MTISESTKAQIKKYEGLGLTAYKCQAGYLTIGYGHIGNDVHPGKKITKAEADALFDRDLSKIERQVDAALGAVNLRQCQWDALVSFVFNVGAGNFARSTLLRKVRSYPDNPAIREEFLRWKYAGGRVLPELLRRREWEAKRYFGEV